MEYEAFGESNEKEFINVLNSAIEIIEEDEKLEPLKYIEITGETIKYGNNATTCDYDTEFLAQIINRLIFEINELKKGK